MLDLKFEKNGFYILHIDKISLRYEFLRDVLDLKIGQNVFDILDIDKASLPYEF